MPHWRLYYPNHATYDSDDGAFVDAPNDGVQAIKKRDSKGRLCTFHGHDFYPWAPDSSLYGTDDLGPILRTLGWIKFGATVDDSHFRDILARVSEDDLK